MPDSPEERQFDDLLAGACVYHAVLRHAGRIEETYSTNGRIYIQHGKDLRAARKWIGAGGYLAQYNSADMYRNALAEANRATGGTALLPRPTEFFADTHHVLPLLGNLAVDHPNEAAQLAIECLRPIE